MNSTTIRDHQHDGGRDAGCRERDSSHAGRNEVGLDLRSPRNGCSKIGQMIQAGPGVNAGRRNHIKGTRGHPASWRYPPDWYRPDQTAAALGSFRKWATVPCLYRPISDWNLGFGWSMHVRNEHRRSHVMRFVYLLNVIRAIINDPNDGISRLCPVPGAFHRRCRRTLVGAKLTADGWSQRTWRRGGLKAGRRCRRWP